MPLVTAPNLASPDDFYQALIEESHALNARLILLLANHIGAMEVLRDALASARSERNAN
jgi:hypothetical protein